MKNKVTDSIINTVVVKRWNRQEQVYDRINVEHDMLLCTFLIYVDNLSTISDVSWSIDYLNPDDTLATVYVNS